uniref:Melanocortin 2 receptor accessory protein 2b n=1 Tax=Echeneis naucrates TaxID=173247 RepID=A0A665UYD7_ECHNA
MSDFHNRSRSSAGPGDYVWQYEYYDDEEPVSFEGLKAHRYSIVIGFWVGLAVFVIFMFFVLTLLTKTGAPNPDSAEKRHRPGSCVVDSDVPQGENDKAFSRPLLAESRSYFHFYINEEDKGEGRQRLDEKRLGKHFGAEAQLGGCKGRKGTSSSGMDPMEDDAEEAGDRHPLNELLEEGKSDRKCPFLSHFTIPNFVNFPEHSSTLGEDLPYEPSVTLEHQSHSQDARCDIHRGSFYEG